MTELERVLEDCLHDLGSGASTVDECLARHPELAASLKPLLLTAARLEQGRAVQPSAAFKARARARLTLHMQAHPRKRARFAFSFFARLAAGLAVIALALLSVGAVYAQNALPGDLLYEWKLASEMAWRALSPDPIRADLVIANRRIEEMNAVADDPVRRAEALKGYEEVLNRLRSELDAETLEQILPRIEIEHTPVENPTPAIPAVTSTPTSPAETTAPPSDTAESPLPSLPEIIPTIDIPPLLP